MNKKYIICIASKPWGDTPPDRTQQLMSHLKDCIILYFYPTSLGKEVTISRHEAKVEEHVYSYGLPKQFPNISMGLLADLRMNKLAQYIKGVMNKHHVKDGLLWLTHPIHFDLVSHLSYGEMVYDCVGYWSEGLQLRQDRLVEQADLIFCVSGALHKDLSEQNKNAVLLPNGVDESLFQKLLQETAPHVPSKGRKNWFGFAGTVDFDLDLSPLVCAAKERPLWKFCIMGQCYEENPFLEELYQLPNVLFCGHYPPDVVAEFLCSCSVLMDFRKLQGENFDQTEYFRNTMAEGFSSRLYEYFMTGKPIVANFWQYDLEPYPDVIYSSYSEGEFLAQCEVALAEPPQLVSARRKKHGKNASWKNRSRRVEQIFSTAGFL